MSARARFLRILRRAFFGVLGTPVVLVLLFCVGLSTAPGRRLALRVTNDALAGRFRGRVVLDEVETLTPWRGAATLRGRVLDPEGHEVVRIAHAGARIDLARLAFSLAGSGPIDVALRDVTVDDARVSLATSEGGALAVARAFAPAASSAVPPGRGVTFDSGELIATRVTVDEPRIPGGSALVRDARGSVHFEGGHLRVLVASFTGDVGAASGARAPADPWAALGVVSVAGRGSLLTMVDDLASLELDLMTKATAPHASADLAVHYRRETLGSVQATLAPELARDLGLPFTPTVPIEVAIALTGPAEAIDATGKLTAGTSRVDVTARANVVSGAVHADLHAHDVDARLASPDLPTSRLTATASVDVDLAKRTARGGVRVDAGTVAHIATPPASGSFAWSAGATDFDVTTDAPASLEALAPKGLALRGHGTARLKGRVDLATQTIDARASLSVTGARAGAVSASRLDATADVRGPLTAPTALVDARAHGLTVPGARPATVVAHGTARRSADGVIVNGVRASWSAGGVTADARADVVAIGPGVRADRVTVTGLGEPIVGKLELTDRAFALTARSGSVDTERVSAIAPLPAEVRGDVDADVDLRLDGGGVHGSATLRTKEVHAGTEKARGEVTLRGRGKTVEVEGNLQVARLGRLRIPKTEVRIDGDPRRAATWERAAGEMTAESDVAIRDLVGRFVDEDLLQVVGRAHTKVRVARERPGGPLVTRFDVTTRGLELYTGAAYARGAEVAVSGVLDGASLAVSAEAFDARGTVLATRLLVAAEPGRRLDLTRSPLHATVTLPARALDSLVLDDTVHGSEVHAAAVLEATGSLTAPHLVGWTRAAVPGTVEARVDELDLTWDRARSALPSGIVRARGRVAIPEIVARLRERLPEAFAASGELMFDVQARREPSDALPSGRAIVTTRGLAIRNGELTLDGADARVSAAFRAPTGEATLSATAWDAAGALLSVDAKAALPRAPVAAGDVARLVENGYREVPIAVRATLPPRKVASFAPLFSGGARRARAEDDAPATRSAWASVEGGVALEASATGTFAHPSIVVRGEALGLRQAERGRRTSAAPVDGALYATYDGKRADVGVTVIDAGKPTLQAALTSVMSLDALAAGEMDVRASGDVRVRGLRVGVLPVIGASVKGTFDGDVLLRDYGKDARIEAKLTGRDASLDSVRVKTAEIRLFAHDTDFSAALGLEQADGGWAGGELQSGMRWGDALAPSLDDARPLRLAYRVDAFRLAALRPLVRTSLPELDGRLDGRGTLERTAGVDSASGSLTLSGGSAYVPLLGQNVEDVGFDMRLGTGTFTLERGSARIDRGEVAFAASGRVEGLALTGIRGELRVRSGKDLPIYYEGIRYGSVTGSASLEGRLDAKNIHLDVTVPKARLELAGLEARTVQKLDDDKHVRVGFRTAAGFQLAPRARTRGTAAAGTGLARPLVVRTTLGSEVVLSQGATLYLPMQGELEVTALETPRLDGVIELAPGGTLNIKGRRFAIESGTLTWTPEEEPSNPTVVATATWEAPEKSIVIATFRGPAKTGKLELRSEPAHTTGEILSLLLVGTPDGKVEGASGAVSAQVGAPIAGGLGQAVSELTSVEVNATVESPDARTTRPEVSVRVRPEVTVQVGYNIAPQTVEQDRLLLTVDWRFAQRWSVQATGGDRGAAIFDLLWQYRY